MTRSLQDAGLDFDTAYELASAIRDELSIETQVTTRQLRARVLKHLRRHQDREPSRRYQHQAGSLAAISVTDGTGQSAAFSRAHHTRDLEACGLPSAEAVSITESIHSHLLKEGIGTIKSRHLDGLTHACLQRELGAAPAYRYLVWKDFQHSGRPLILLIGGTTGCGKSTLATLVANRLEIVRTQSTDMLREVMRTMVSQRLLPVLHHSSFEAWKGLSGGTPEQLTDAYYAQAELLSVTCEAVVNRALRERVSLILEGVHIQPTLLERLPESSDALVIPIMLAVLNPKRLRIQIRGRGHDVPQRRSERYLESFDAIWQLQALLLSEADRTQIPIIENDDKDKVFLEIMRVVIGRLTETFNGSPQDVFGQRDDCLE